MSDIVERLRSGEDGLEYAAADEIERLRAERDRLREALQAVLGACDQGRLVERGAGGMTLEAQMRRSVYNHVPAWPIEEARAALKEAGHE
jgi:hypothetical protein